MSMNSRNLAGFFWASLAGVLLALLLFFQGCGKVRQGSAESDQADEGFVAVSESLEARLTPPGKDTPSVDTQGVDAPLVSWPVALLIERESPFKNISGALQSSGFAVLEIRERHGGKTVESFEGDSWVPSSEELDRAIKVFEQTESIDPGTMGIIGAGDGVLPAAALAGGLSESEPTEVQLHGMNSDLSPAAQGQSTNIPHSETQRSSVFLLLLLDSLSDELKGELVKVLQKVQAPLLCLISEEGSETEADSVKEVLLAALDKGANHDYTVKIIRSDEQESLQPFIDRWFRARF